MFYEVNSSILVHLIYSKFKGRPSKELRATKIDKFELIRLVSRLLLLLKTLTRTGGKEMPWHEVSSEMATERQSVIISRHSQNCSLFPKGT